jgi:hypothetical protein
MAVAVASSTSATTDNGTSVAPTKPTGLAVGDALVAVVHSHNNVGGVTTIATPSGWEKLVDIPNSAAADNQRTCIFAKIATSGDVSASDFTFTQTSSVYLRAFLMRVTDTRTDDIYDGISTTGSATDTTNPQVYSGLSVTPTQGNCLLILTHASSGNEAWIDSTSPVINGTNPTWTKQYNDIVDVFTAPLASSQTVTSISITMGSTGGDDTVMGFAVINGKNSADTTPTFATATSNVFAPTGRAGASLTPGYLQADTVAFAPEGQGTSPTQWTNDTKPTTTWTNEE